jgi:hypothetical protein
MFVYCHSYKQIQIQTENKNVTASHVTAGTLFQFIPNNDASVFIEISNNISMLSISCLRNKTWNILQSAQELT